MVRDGFLLHVRTRRRHQCAEEAGSNDVLMRIRMKVCISGYNKIGPRFLLKVSTRFVMTCSLLLNNSLWRSMVTPLTPISGFKHRMSRMLVCEKDYYTH